MMCFFFFNFYSLYRHINIHVFITCERYCSTQALLWRKIYTKICVSRLENLQNSVQFVYPSFARFEKCFLTCIQKNKCSWDICNVCNEQWNVQEQILSFELTEESILFKVDIFINGHFDFDSDCFCNMLEKLCSIDSWHDIVDFLFCRDYIFGSLVSFASITLIVN